MIRRVLVWTHRWTGLAMSAFLVVAGATGAALAFNSELEHVFAPQLFATPRPGTPALDFATLAEKAEPLLAPRARVIGVLRTETDQVQVSFSAIYDPATGKRFALDYTQFYIDPWTGAELGHRRRGDLSEGLVNVMPFLYLAHFMIVPQSQTGFLVFGLVAITWTLDCFVAFSLTFPTSLSHFWRRWSLAWRVRKGGAAYRLNVDLHRASGLWLSPLLFVFAWSSVMMNMRPFFNAVSHAVFDYGTREGGFVMAAAHPKEHPGLDWHEALAIGQRIMAEQAATHGFSVGQPLGLQYNVRSGSYAYEVRGSRDLFERAPKGGSTVVSFDGDTGALRRLSQPTGEHAGITVESWLYALHMARVGGRPYQLFTCLVGLATALLSGTGVYIWWKKRGFRRVIAERRAQLRAHQGGSSMTLEPAQR
jgi:uncharacterized iron-regulated membrane protein